MKTYRLYFNKEAEWPQCWSVDEGDQASEINVCGFQLNGVIAAGVLLPIERRGNGERMPFAWMEIRDAHLTLRAGIAVFTNG